jgi:DNA-dependent RNA polymerase auxiliary subunit epsilon
VTDSRKKRGLEIGQQQLCVRQQLHSKSIKFQVSFLNRLSGSELRHEVDRGVWGVKWNERRSEALRAKESFPSPASPVAAARRPVNLQGRRNLCVSIGGMDKKGAEGRRRQSGDGRREGRSIDVEWE